MSRPTRALILCIWLLANTTASGYAQGQPGLLGVRSDQAQGRGQAVAGGVPLGTATTSDEATFGDMVLSVFVSTRPADPKLAGESAQSILARAVPVDLIVEVSATVTGSHAPSVAEVLYGESAFFNSARGTRANGYRATLRSQPGARLTATVAYSGMKLRGTTLTNRHLTARTGVPPIPPARYYDAEAGRFYEREETRYESRGMVGTGSNEVTGEARYITFFEGAPGSGTGSAVTVRVVHIVTLYNGATFDRPTHPR